MALVSVVIPFLNAARTIQEAVDSVFAQSYTNWELLLVDDGSTDESTAIARNYAERHPARVRYLEHEAHRNKGMSASRNAGIRAAKGEFVALLDADDIWLADKLMRQVALMDSQPATDFIFSPALYRYEDGTTVLQRSRIDAAPMRSVWVALMLRSDDNAACPSTVLMKRHLALRVGGFEEVFLGVLQSYEDQAMWCKVALNASVLFDPLPTAVYRIHSASWSGGTSVRERLEARIGFCSWLRDYLRLADAGRVLTAMTACRLTEALLEKERSIDKDAAVGPVSRIVRRARLFPGYRDQMGWLFAGILMIGATSHFLARALTRVLFLTWYTGYDK